MNVEQQEEQEEESELRALNAERFNLQKPNANIVMVCHVKGKIDEKDFKNALLEMQKIHPLLRASIVFDENDDAFFKINKLKEESDENIDEIELIIDDINTNNNWLEISKAELMKPFDISKSPLIRINLIKSEIQAYIILSVDNSICDSLSIIYLIRDILSKTAHPEKFFKPKIIQNSLKLGYIDKNLQILFEKTNKKWKQDKKIFSNEDYKELHNVFWKKMGRPHVLDINFFEDETKVILAKAKEHNVTITSILITVFYFAEQDVIKWNDNNLVFNINIREFLPEIEEDIGYFSSTIVRKLIINPDHDFWTNTERINRELSKKITEEEVFVPLHMSILDPTLIDSFYFWQFDLFKHPITNKLAPIVANKRDSQMIMNNLENLPIPEVYGDLEIISIHGPIIYPHLANKSVSFTIINGKLSLVFSFSETKLRIEDAMEIRKNIRNQLIKHL